MMPFGVADDEHLSGCPEDCPVPLHLTEAACDTLRRGGNSEAAIAEVLDYEATSHRLRRQPKRPPGEWTPNVEATLRSCGVDEASIDAARASVETSSRMRALRAERAEADSRAREKDWKAANRDRVAAHSRAYRARKRLEVVR